MSLERVIVFLNQPIILTLVTLAVGGYLLNIISDRRARKLKLQEKGIEFLEDVGNNFNAVLSKLAGIIRSGKISTTSISKLNDRIGILFKNRFSVRIRSAVYLKSNDFSRKYELLMWELRHIAEFLATISKSYQKDEIVTQIKEHQTRLAEMWPYTDKPSSQSFEPPYDELWAWRGMIWKRAIDLLSTHLQKTLK